MQLFNVITPQLSTFHVVDIIAILFFSTFELNHVGPDLGYNLKPIVEIQ